MECGRVAQLVERAPEKREVTGSTPVPTTKAITIAIEERLKASLEVRNCFLWSTT